MPKYPTIPSIKSQNGSLPAITPPSSGGAPSTFTYLRPDGTSTFRRPDGTSQYKRP